MSTDRLTADERATYLIGQAFRRIMANYSPNFPEAVRAQAWSAYAEVLPAALTPEEVDTVMTTTGLVGEGWIDFPPVPQAVTGQAEAGEFYYPSEDIPMKRFTVEVDDTTATNLQSLAQLCTEADKQREGATTHGALTVQKLLAMLAEDAGLVISRPGSWEGANMEQVFSSHGYQF
jgi:hypothetical protein